MELAWYTYFSFWVFIWFIFFQLGLTRFSPYLMYVFIVIFILFKFMRDTIYLIFYDDGEEINYDAVFVWVVNVIVIDLIPPFFLERQVDRESILFTLLLSLIYCFYMTKWNHNIIKHYDTMNYREISNRFTPKTFMEGVLQIDL